MHHQPCGSHELITVQHVWSNPKVLFQACEQGSKIQPVFILGKFPSESAAAFFLPHLVCVIKCWQSSTARDRILQEEVKWRQKRQREAPGLKSALKCLSVLSGSQQLYNCLAFMQPGLLFIYTDFMVHFLSLATCVISTHSGRIMFSFNGLTGRVI